MINFSIVNTIPLKFSQNDEKDDDDDEARWKIWLLAEVWMWIGNMYREFPLRRFRWFTTVSGVVMAEALAAAAVVAAGRHAFLIFMN